MGLMRRIADAADRVYSASDLSGVAARFNRRREGPMVALLASGTPAVAVITGLRRRWATDGDGAEATTLALRLEWESPGGMRAGGVAITGQGVRSPGLRLGARVPVRHDDEHVMIDHPLPAGTGVALMGSPPEPGVDDRVIDGRRIARWVPETATVDAVTRGTVPLLGMPADRWEITLRRVDGSLATCPPGDVPPYAQHHIAPGAEAPIVVDPDDPTAARIDWTRLALERAATAGDVDDPPPVGSIAASLVEAAPTRGPAVAASAGAGVDVASPASGTGDAVEGVTLETYARVQAALQTARVAPGDLDAFAAREFGTPLGRWEAIDAEWRRRMVADWRVGAAVGEAVENARRGR